MYHKYNVKNRYQFWILFWNQYKYALKKAQSYQETISMSPSAIYDQLVSEYGEQFTAEEAQYAIDNLQ